MLLLAKLGTLGLFKKLEQLGMFIILGFVLAQQEVRRIKRRPKPQRNNSRITE
jgi:hypothetical protein